MQHSTSTLQPSESPEPKNPLVELFAYLADMITRCRAARWLGALFHAEVLRDIAADVRAWVGKLRGKAIAIEADDKSAESELEAGIAAMKAGRTRAAWMHFKAADHLMKQSGSEAHVLAAELVTE